MLDKLPSPYSARFPMPLLWYRYGQLEQLGHVRRRLHVTAQALETRGQAGRGDRNRFAQL